jgi:hypothetical protein
VSLKNVSFLIQLDWHYRRHHEVGQGAEYLISVPQWNADPPNLAFRQQGSPSWLLTASLAIKRRFGD